MEDHLQKEARLKLEDVTFDIQCFISEHTQFLSPAKSSYLLKFLSTTQRAFRDQIERLVTQKSALDVLLDARERENLAEVCLCICYKYVISLRFFLERKSVALFLLQFRLTFSVVLLEFKL